VVGRADNRGDDAARGHLRPGDLHLSKRLAVQGNDRAIVPQALLERIWDQRQVVGEKAHLLRIFQQAIQGQRERLRRQVIAGDNAELHEGQRLTLGQPVAALRSLEEVGDQVLPALVSKLRPKQPSTLRLVTRVLGLPHEGRP